MFVENQQRFTIRKGTTTIGTGVFTEVCPPQTNEEKVRYPQITVEEYRLIFLSGPEDEEEVDEG